MNRIVEMVLGVKIMPFDVNIGLISGQYSIRMEATLAQARSSGDNVGGALVGDLNETWRLEEEAIAYILERKMDDFILLNEALKDEVANPSSIPQPPELWSTAPTDVLTSEPSSSSLENDDSRSLSDYGAPRIYRNRSLNAEFTASGTNLFASFLPALEAWFKDLIRKPDIVRSAPMQKFLNAAPRYKAIETTFSSDEESDDAIDEDIASYFREKRAPFEKKSKTLDDFLLLKVIGKGSFGKVMLVREVSSGKTYAMKVLEKAQVVKRNQIEHTKTERNVLEYIRHPFIVELKYAFQTNEKLVLVMSYCPGGEVFYHLSRMGRFPEEQTRFYAAQITLAFEYLHDLGIVFRDCKPENVLLDADGNIVLTDFGLCKEGILDNVSASSLCGTPEYLAPEVLTRSGHGRAADWWSLGALIFEMLTGMPPFYSRDRSRLFQKILRGTLRFPANVSDEAQDLLRGLLNRDIPKRLGSKDDARELKAHRFFHGIDWKLLQEKKIAPPFRPCVDSKNASVDISNFDQEFTMLPVDSLDSPTEHISSVMQDRFAGFSFRGSLSTDVKDSSS